MAEWRYMTRIIAFSNQKGGVGKTTSCVSLAAALGQLGKRVLLIDFDPQGNATSGVGVDKKLLRHSVYDLLTGSIEPDAAVVPTEFPGISLIPSKIELAAAEIELNGTLSKDSNPLSFLQEWAEPKYDYVLIDCPPSLGMLTITALSASDAVIIPMQCEFYALEGLSQLLPTIKRVRKYYNPELQLAGILLTMYNGRLTLTRQVVDEIKRFYPDKLFRTPISRSVRLSEAPGFGRPIQYLEPSGKSTQEYADVARELIERM